MACLVVPAAALIAGAVFALGVLVVNSVDAMSADGSDPDPCSRSPVGLIEAAAHHEVDKVAILLARGLDPDRRSGGVSALSCAVRDDAGASAQRLATMRLLLEAGADPDDTAGGADSPLLLVAVAGDRPAVELLLEHGADPTDELAIALARSAGHEGVARLIERAGAQVAPPGTTG